MEKSAKEKTELAVAVVLASLLLLFVVTAIAIAMSGSSEATAQERCERLGGIWHASAGHGADTAHCMGGAAEGGRAESQGE